MCRSLLIRGAEELEHRMAGIRQSTDHLIREDELSDIFHPLCAAWLDRREPDTLGLRIPICVERRVGDALVARPPAGADHFGVRAVVADDARGVWKRHRPSGADQCEVEGAPEELDGAAPPTEAGAMRLGQDVDG